MLERMPRQIVKKGNSDQVMLEKADDKVDEYAQSDVASLDLKKSNALDFHVHTTEPDVEWAAAQLQSETIDCPMMRFVGLISGKWAIPVLYRLALLNTPIRFGELLRQLQPITQKELTKHLKNFERHGLLTRQVYPEIPPRVEYRITALGLTLQQPLAALADWMERYADQVPNLQRSTEVNDS